MIRKLVFLYTNEGDPLVASAKEASRGIEGAEFINIHSLVKYLHPAPWPTIIEQDFPEELKNKFDSAIVVNRVFEVDADLQKSNVLRYGNHAQWLYAALMPLLDSAFLLTHDIGVRGASKTLLPLNTQWALISNFGRNGISVPKFALGFGREEPDIDGLKSPMQKSVWSIYDWKEEKGLSESERDWNKFYIETPVGVPVITHYIGADNWWSSYPDGDAKVGADVLRELVSRCSECFKSSIGEILVYVEPDGLVRFHAFTPYLMSASNSEEFGARVERWINACTADSSVTCNA